MTERVLRYTKIKFFRTTEKGMRTVRTHGSKMIADMIMAIDDRYEIPNRSSSLKSSGANPNHSGVPTAPMAR